MLARDSDKEWEKFGRRDPYYGVITHDRFRKSKLDDKSLVEFFKSGQDHVEYVLDTIRVHVQDGFSPSRVLDFGCGVGRCAIPLTRISKFVVGVDISDSMLEEARKNCSELSISNLQLTKSDDNLSQVAGNFDLIHSSFVFQNIPRKRGEKIFKRLVELLSDNGIGVIQFLFHRDVSPIVKFMGYLRQRVPLLHYFANLLYGKPLFEPLMEKNVYDLNLLMRLLSETGCGNLHINCFREDNHQYCILYFQKKRDHVPHDSLE